MVFLSYKAIKFCVSLNRVYYKRTKIDPDVDFVQETIKKPSELGYSDWQTKNGKMVKVIKIDARYYFTTYNVSIQVFNEMCEDPYCAGPRSEQVEITSAEDLPQVTDNTAYVSKDIIKLKCNYNDN